jgi:predicted DNA-binding transcriptional regulator
MSKTKKPKKEKDRINELALEIDIMNHMVVSLVDVLEKKGVLTSEEWEKEVKSKVESTAKTALSFREVES